MQNKIVKKLFVCEFITSGGLNDTHLPEALALEGRLMRDALLNDLHQIESLHLITTHDKRIGRSQYSKDSIEVNAETDVLALWKACMLAADYIWLIAPESSGVLYQLTEMAVAIGRPVIGCDLDAVEVTSDKYKAAKVLQGANMITIPSFYFDEWKPEGSSSKWVVKPIDGAGCEETYIFEDSTIVANWFNADLKKQKNYIIQPYIEGIPASISVLGYSDAVMLLSCNCQQISSLNGQLRYMGGEINGALAYWDLLEALAVQLKSILPGLNGYFGVDVILDEQDLDKITIVEINPRLTTSYIKLREAIGQNPAQIILNALLNEKIDMPKITKKKLRFEIIH